MRTTRVPGMRLLARCISIVALATAGLSDRGVAATSISTSDVQLAQALRAIASDLSSSSGPFCVVLAAHVGSATQRADVESAALALKSHEPDLLATNLRRDRVAKALRLAARAADRRFIRFVHRYEAEDGCRQSVWIRAIYQSGGHMLISAGAYTAGSNENAAFFFDTSQVNVKLVDRSDREIMVF